ncbi:MAG: hypothetical protein ABI262_17820 [Microcoleus sp.]
MEFGCGSHEVVKRRKKEEGRRKREEGRRNKKALVVGCISFEILASVPKV